MPDTTPNTVQPGIRPAYRQGWDVDFLRAKFNLSAKDVEKAIQHAGNSRDKIIEYFRKLFAAK